MANTLTNLRELSVGVSFFCHNTSDAITPEQFRTICESYIQNFDITTNIASSDSFTALELDTIKNGFALGNTIQEILNISRESVVVTWRGNEKDNLIDLQINEFSFSLKENSFILKNMGLYNMLNILTNSNKFKRGLHIFKIFAPREFEAWFKSALECLVTQPEFTYFGASGYKSYGKIQDDNLILSLDSTNVSIPNFYDLTYDEFEELTTTELREKVFCKWLSDVANDNYYNKKRTCANVAGLNLQKYINDNLVPSSPLILQLFNLEQEEYIYAKNDGNTIQIARVPGLNTVDYNDWVIEKVETSIPNSQLNLKTTIKNLKTGKSCTLRNEIRYSHGQLNGTPEAKLYIESKDNLADIVYISLL